MKILFKIEGTAGNSELKDLLSFADVDLKLKNLLPDIESASQDIIDLIGQDIYDLAIAAYEQDPIKQEDKDFIKAVRYPIAVNAYRLFAPSGDIAHTNNGRKMRVDDGVKMPFEWLLDRDNKALEIRYYRALDTLIKFLDTTDDTELKALWKESVSYKISRELFVYSTFEFNRIFPIESRLLYIKLIPGLKDCEDYHLKAVLGKEKFLSLKASLQSSEEITNETDLKLIELIKKASVFHAMAWSMPRYSVNLYPEGVLQHYVSDKITTKAQKPTLKSEPTEARLAFEADSQKALKAIQKLLEPPITIEENNLIPNQLYGDKFFSA